MPFGKIDELLRRGEIVYWGRYDEGTFADFSGYGNVPDVKSNVRLEGDGLWFNDANGYIRIPDSSELQLTRGTLIALSKFVHAERSTQSWVISKRDAGGTNYDFRLDSTPQLELYDGTSTRVRAASYYGAEMVGMTFADGETGVGFVDGVSVGDFSGTSTVSTDDAPLYIGNYYVASGSMYNPLHGIMIINRPLIESEVAQVTGELMNLRIK
jgi:hypothetical protein